MTWSDPEKLTRVKDFGISGIAFCVAREPGSGKLFFGNSDFKVYEVDALAEKPAPAAFEAEGNIPFSRSRLLTQSIRTARGKIVDWLSGRTSTPGPAERGLPR